MNPNKIPLGQRTLLVLCPQCVRLTPERVGYLYRDSDSQVLYVSVLTQHQQMAADVVTLFLYLLYSIGPTCLDLIC